VSAIPAALWIDRAAALADACARWDAAGEVALDTEFVFERTYFPRLGLIQVAAAGEVALVDPLAIADLSALGRLLEAPGVTKLVHAAGQDAAVLVRATGVVPAPLFDTQVAAALAGLGASLSYAALIQSLLGVTLDKHETRTDWLRRPLRPEQLRYAAEDVVHLAPAAALLRARLAELGRLAWAAEESAAAAAPALERAEPELAWRRLRGIDRLKPRARRIARTLAAWREIEALRLDLARPFLLRDETLLALARQGAIDGESALRLPGFDARRHAGLVGDWGRALAAAIAAADAPDALEVPVPPPASRERAALDRELAELAATTAGELGLAPELLLPRRTRERMLDAWEAGRPPGEPLSGWRSETLAAPLAGLAARRAGALRESPPS
jgi:ribonuclease D